MLKGNHLKNELTTYLFGILMIASLSGCGNASVGESISNKMIDNTHSMIKLPSSQFEIDKEYSDKVVFKNENECYMYDDSNEVYIYAADKSLLGLNSTSTDTNILSHMETFFLDEQLSFNTKGESVQKNGKINENEYVKYLFKDLHITAKDGKEYIGKLSIIDYGDNEVFVLVYSDNKDKLDASYIVKSLKPLDSNRIILIDNNGDEIENSYITYEHYVEMQEELARIEAEKNVVIEVEPEFDFTPILTNNKQFKGKYYSFSGYYDLEKKSFKDESGNETQTFRDCYLKETRDFVLEFDVINLNDFNRVYGDATNAEQKKEYITNFYKNQANEDLSEKYTDEEIVELYNIVISNGAMQTFLDEYKVDVDSYGSCKVVTAGVNQWILVKGYKPDEDTSMAFALTVDEFNNAYMLVFRYTNELDKVVDNVMQSFNFNSETPIVLNEKQIGMYGEFLNVR